MAESDIPPGMHTDARESWPPQELIESFLGTFDFEFRPGEDVGIPVDDEAAQAAARRFRDVLGRYCSGVTVVTSVAEGQPVGMTCQSFSSVSLDPPLVMFIPAKSSRAFPQMRKAGFFCVNFLAADQQDLSNTFASRGIDKFAGVDWSPATSGAPLLSGVVGYVDCSIEAVHEAGDHYVVVGRVLDLAVGDAQDPLVYYRGSYHTTT
ncbi:flavin reductase family protein [Nocardioides limicola]|uniref:flavin reductase family protein n=1 Tax=Nocardioides limicola TaxID=2803368 RepID=UPI001EF0D356|nr:flavin reductase family protein [Nocardioides sp. DJM-14]